MGILIFGSSITEVCGWFVLQSVGVKFKVYVKDKDSGWFNSDDDVDSFVQLLQLTPDLNVSVANWTTLVMYGMRSSHTTK